MVTLWYRSPEILLNTQYSQASDIWALGCILAELLNHGRPILPGQNEIDQYSQICNLIGRPTPESWPVFFDLPVANRLLPLNENTQVNLEMKFQASAVRLLSQMLTWDPEKRITVEEILLSDFFTEHPFPSINNRYDFLN